MLFRNEFISTPLSSSPLTLVILLVLLATACKKEPVTTPTIEPIVYDLKIPKISINTDNQTIVNEPKITATMEVTDHINHDEAVIDYTGMIGIELRGSSSQDLFDKKSYGFETRAADGSDMDVSILELPEEEDWILNGPYSDKTLIRNTLIYTLAEQMGAYASKTKFCELTIDNDYKGMYVLMEKLKRDKNRIDISKLNPDENEGDDVTGGYIIKIDKSSGNGSGQGDYTDENSFPSDYNFDGSTTVEKQTFFVYDYPTEDNISDPQKEYIQGYIRDFETVLLSDEFDDPETGYAAYIDVSSFIDFIILNEWSHNVDAYRLSTYLTKDKNGLLKAGPIWDFNIALGNANFCNGGDTDNWIFNFNDYCPWDFWLTHFWWERLMEDEAFTDQLKQRYQELRMTVLSEANVNMIIESQSDLLIRSGAVDRNFKEWNILREEIWPNDQVANTYEGEVNYLKQWIINRSTWMDNNIGNL